MRRLYGTDNAIMNALADGHCGYAGLVRCVSNRLCLGDSQAALQGRNRLAFNHDEASYSGWHVNVGAVLDLCSERAFLLKATGGKAPMG